jgi:hypothetical protein
MTEIKNIDIYVPQSTPIILQTHRYVFSEEFTSELYEFAKIHQYDDRKTFKDSWKEWLDDKDIALLVKSEVNRLEYHGFVGDVHDKMYKSARYYYRKKSNQPTIQPERKEYVGFSKEILSGMDTHIKNQIIANTQIKKNKTISTISPAKGFDFYYEENKHQIIKELHKERTNPNNTISRDVVVEITNRYKKTYKNRFYKIREAMRLSM